MSSQQSGQLARCDSSSVNEKIWVQELYASRGRDYLVVWPAPAAMHGQSSCYNKCLEEFRYRSTLLCLLMRQDVAKRQCARGLHSAPSYALLMHGNEAHRHACHVCSQERYRLVPRRGALRLMPPRGASVAPAQTHLHAKHVPWADSPMPVALAHCRMWTNLCTRPITRTCPPTWPRCIRTCRRQAVPHPNIICCPAALVSPISYQGDHT